MRIPVVDLQRSAAPIEQALASEELGAYFVANHGVPQPLMARALRETARFHALPLERKLSIRGTLRDPRGYLRPPDTMDTYYLSEERAGDEDSAAGTAARSRNKWIEGLPGFREAMLEYMSAMSRLVRRLLALQEQALGLVAGTIAEHEAFKPPRRLLRLLHYPSRDEAGMEPAELSAHTDYGYLTVIAQSAVAGFELQTQAGSWLQVPAEQDLLLVVNGDMCQFWTNGRFRAPLHRALNAMPQERHSVVFFTAPRPDVALDCWDGCVDRDQPAARSFGAHFSERLRARMD
jgi:isopenicillin N synthase-like dioxygenase